MLVFFRCVAEAVMENGVRGLMDMVPGGKYACDVAAGAWKKYRERKKDAEIRAEIQKLAAASFEEARIAAVEVARDVAARAPIEDRLNLEMYLSQVPGTVRQSLKRPDDVSGKTVPRGFSLDTPEAVRRLLPERSLRFKPGDPVAGLEGWSLVKPLGAGGFGEVWLARNRANAAECGAVKFCHGQRAQDLRHEHTLIRRVMAAGAHPNIVPLLNANLECESPWLLYEYVQGTDLGDWVRSLQSQSTEERVRQAVLALRQLCPAIAHFHQLTPAIVHRDLKPSNILVDRVSKRVRITDFGIGAVAAKSALAEAATGTTSAGRLVSVLRGAHTPLYASPQQRNGDDPDPRDDVHALGVVAYQLLTGQLTQGPGTDFGDDLRERGADPALIDLIGECVAQNPARRPADASELLRRVQALASVLAPPADPHSAPSPPVPPDVPVPAPAEPPRSRSSRRRAREQDEPLQRRDRSPRRGISVWGWLAIAFGGCVVVCCGGPLGLLLVAPRTGTTGPKEEVRLNTKGETTGPASPAPAGPGGPAPVTPTGPAPPGSAIDIAEENKWTAQVKAASDPNAMIRLKGIEGLASFLVHPKVQFRQRAARALAALGADAASVRPALRAAGNDPDDEVRRSARLALEKIDAAVASAVAAESREAILALAKDLKAPDPATKIKALEQIAAYGLAANVLGELLIDALWEKDPGVRSAASHALEKANPKVHHHVITILYGMDKQGAVLELGKLGPDAAIAVPFLLYLHDTPRTSGTPSVPVPGAIPSPQLGYLITSTAKIAPRDKRFASAVLATIAAPVPKDDATQPYNVGPRLTRRLEALAQIGVIEAVAADKAKALVSALGDGWGTTEVIAALEGLGRDAAPALPALRQLKLSPNDAIRKAATKAVERIE